MAHSSCGPTRAGQDPGPQHGTLMPIRVPCYDADQGAVLPCQIRSRWYGAAEVSVINRAWIGPPGPPPLAEKLGRRVSEAAGGTWDSPCRLGLGALARGRWALILRGGAGLGAEVSAPVVAPAHPGSCCLRTQCH